MISAIILMSIISKQYDPAIGPIIQTTVSAPGNTSEGVVVNLLVDTGATLSSISREVADRIKIKSTSQTEIYTPSGIAQSQTYVCDIGVLFGELSPESPNAVQTNIVIFSNLSVIEFRGSTSNYSRLLGRDVICKGYLHVGFDNRFQFAI